MSKKSLISKIKIVNQAYLSYAIVYEVRGCKYNQPVNSIGLYFSKEEAEKTKENYYQSEIYDTIWLVEKMVWF